MPEFCGQRPQVNERLVDVGDLNGGVPIASGFSAMGDDGDEGEGEKEEEDTDGINEFEGHLEGKRQESSSKSSSVREREQLQLSGDFEF